MIGASKLSSLRRLVKSLNLRARTLRNPTEYTNVARLQKRQDADIRSLYIHLAEATPEEHAFVQRHLDDGIL